MTREQLHSLVDSLPDDELGEAATLLAQLQARGSDLRGLEWSDQAPGPGRPRVVGVLRSGRSDLSERVDEILQDSFAHPR